MGLTREARVRSGCGRLYPDVAPTWQPAATVARQVADQIMARRGYVALLKGRVLPDEHFEFRGGASLRPGGRLSRLADTQR